MIDLSNETLLTLAQATKFLGGRPSVATLWRWRTRGVRGRRLESLNLGGKVFTSLEALQRFAEQSDDDAGPTLRSPARRARDIAEAERFLEEEGI